MKLLHFSGVILLLCTFGFAQENTPHLDKNSSVIGNYFDDDFSDKHENSITFLTHKSNYILPIGYDTREHDDISKHGEEQNRKDFEAKIQLSIKVPMFSNFLQSGGDMYFGYTQKSLFQVYAQDNSAPFRDINHNPELFMDFDMNRALFDGVYLKKVRATISHESNGQTLPKSRSWNYTSAEAHLLSNNLRFGGVFWYRWHEENKTPDDPKRDDNPDLTDKIGNTKIYAQYHFGDIDTSLSYQFKLHHYDINKGNISLDVLIPSFHNQFDWMFQYFYGYGESLLDYDEKVNKFYFGISLSHW